MDTLKEAYSTHDAVSAALDGKYSEVTADASGHMSVNATTFARQSIVAVNSDMEIDAVDTLSYEVIFDVAADVDFVYPDYCSVVGSENASKRRIYSILDGNIVVGNFN